MSDTASLQSRENYLDLKLNFIFSQPEDSRRVYVADGPLAGEDFDMAYSVTELEHPFFDNRGTHSVRYLLTEYPIVFFDGTLFQLVLVWDLLYCAREPDVSDTYGVPPRVLRLEKDCPPASEGPKRQAWQSFACGQRTAENDQEWDELAILCESTVGEVLDLAGLGPSR